MLLFRLRIGHGIVSGVPVLLSTEKPRCKLVSLVDMEAGNALDYQVGAVMGWCMKQGRLGGGRGGGAEGGREGVQERGRGAQPAAQRPNVVVGGRGLGHVASGQSWNHTQLIAVRWLAVS